MIQILRLVFGSGKRQININRGGIIRFGTTPKIQFTIFGKEFPKDKIAKIIHLQYFHSLTQKIET